MTDIQEKPHHGNKWMPVMYATYYGILIEIARKHGYALALHGSLARDMDLIATPWTDTASDHKDLLTDICKAVGAEGFDVGEPKPHGRIGYSVSIGSGGYLDISFVPRDVDKLKLPVTQGLQPVKMWALVWNNEIIPMPDGMQFIYAREEDVLRQKKRKIDAVKVVPILITQFPEKDKK